MAPRVLQTDLKPTDTAWRFTVPVNLLRTRPGRLEGKLIKFTEKEMTLQMTQFPSNRILHSDDANKFLLLSFGDLRFTDGTLRATGEYIERLMKEGLWLNGVQYRFYHHSNSQLRGRSCFMREANDDAQLDQRIYSQGDFGRIMNVAKRAKRIGLLFSEAQVDLRLPPELAADIPDIESGDQVFSDGCGLISKRLAVQVAKAKRIIFRGSRYTPCVYQIRYLGYKGVVMIHPDMDRADPAHLVQFRKSMRKFKTTQNPTFSVVDYSKPYAFGRLNNEIIVLLSSLGISNEKLLAKQSEYFRWIEDASKNPVNAFDFLASMGDYPLAERVMLNGLDHPEVASAIRRNQLKETKSFRNERNKGRSRMIVMKSRLIFGVCDAFDVLKEGQVHIRITTGRNGPSTPIHGDVLVVRNPCLHPGDCLKLRAVSHDKLNHLHDCIVFASVARAGHQAAPSMSSGGDLDGDKYFVCWDPDLVPSKVMESYDYPPNREQISKNVTRQNLARHFAMYNNAGLARVAALHGRWVRGSPKGALCSECQELNALHSQSVDGASIKIPDRLTSPPEAEEAFIIDVLAEAAAEFAAKFEAEELPRSELASSSIGLAEAEDVLAQLLRSRQHSVSEYELFQLALRLARKHHFSLIPFLGHFDFGAFTSQQKHAITFALSPALSPDDYAYIWNSLLRSDLLSAVDLYGRDLDRPFSLHRLYSSDINGFTTFFSFLRRATQDYTRKLMVLKTDDRFAVGIFMRGSIPWDEDPEVADNVAVCSFLPQSTSNFSTYSRCATGYRLHCSDTTLQLYNKNIGDSFVFITRLQEKAGAELGVSIALQKISAGVQKQLGRLRRNPVAAIELHVVSNRDRVAHQLFDLWFEQ